MATEVTATELLARRGRQLGPIMQHLLHDLREWVRVRGRDEKDDEKLHLVDVDLDVFWVTGLGDGGPETVILNAIKMHPELWVEALPKECCIVPRAILEKLGGFTVESLEAYGAHLVHNQAARLLYEKEEADRQKRWSK